MYNMNEIYIFMCVCVCVCVNTCKYLIFLKYILHVFVFIYNLHNKYTHYTYIHYVNKKTFIMDAINRDQSFDSANIGYIYIYVSLYFCLLIWYWF